MKTSTPSLDTIAAVATPLGEGGLGVVRISGPQCFEIADKIFKGSQPLAQSPTHTLQHGWIVSEGRSIDEAVAALFRSPASFTGEDVIELSCHGSPAVLKSVLELCYGHGIRPAKPGEFTERAFLNGKLDLAQAEAVADLIHSRSAKAQRAAVDQLTGGLSRRVENLRQPLIELLAHLEANLDFVEEDIPGLGVDEAKKKLEKILSSLAELLDTAITGRLLRQGLRVVLVGPPNAGKSSLFNALLKMDRAIVTDVPGTTRDTIEETVEWQGLPVVLIDTAGLRPAGDLVEQLGQARSQQAIARADFLIAVIDGSIPFDDETRIFLHALKEQSFVIALNKSDLPHLAKADQISIPGDSSLVSVSAKTEAGLNDLRKVILKSAGVAQVETEDATVAVNERHRQHLSEAEVRLKDAFTALKNRRSEESIGWDLREAIRSLDRITGADVDRDVLEVIFRSFCIGK